MEFRDAPGHYCNWSETVRLDRQHHRHGGVLLDGWGATIEDVHRSQQMLRNQLDYNWLH